jgi:hypothetical protein
LGWKAQAMFQIQRFNLFRTPSIELGTLNSTPERYMAMTATLLLSLLSIFFPLLLVHAAEDKSSWQVEWGKTVQLAKKEGQLVNYGGEEIIHPEIVKAFNNDYPEIKVTTAGGHGSELWRAHIGGAKGRQISRRSVCRRPNHAVPSSLSEQIVGSHRAVASAAGGYGRVEMVHWKTRLCGS